MDHTHTLLKQISLPIAVFGGGFLLATLMVFAPKEDVTPFLIFLLGISSALVIAILLEPQDFKILFSLFFLAFLARCFLSLLFFSLSYAQIDAGNQIGAGPGFLLPSDGLSYSQNAWEIAKYHLMGIPLTSDAVYRIMMQYAGTITNYDFWNAKVYYHIGKSPLSMFFILSFLSSLTPFFVYSLARGVFNKKIAFWSGFLSAFWPSLIFWPTQNLKEPLVCFGIVLFFYSFVKLIKKFNPLFFLPVIISAFILWRMSPWMLLPMISVIVVSLFMNFTGMGLIPLIWGIVLIVPLFLLFHDEILHFLGAWPLTAAKFSPFLSYSLSLDAIDYLRSVRAYGNLAILPNFDISSPINALLFLPIGLIYAWFAPFPWNVGSISQIIGIPEMMLFYFLFPKLVRGITFSWRQRKKETSVIIIFTVLLSLVLALIEGNAGTLFRHRSFILYFCFIFISVGTFRKELVASEKSKA